MESGNLHTLRIGTGFDAHQFAQRGSGRELWLAGIRWVDDEEEGVAGLLGESDGDVAVHALIDSLLAAAGADSSNSSSRADIGEFFGVGSSSRAIGAHGLAMLHEVVDYLQQSNWRVINASIVVIGNRPKISRHRVDAQSALSEVLQAPVAITATTTDGLGFTGEGRGVAASATSLIERV
jgi:2-C-methyl-D-erythritol 2,4-cyclodiphosphate synthase